MSALTLAATSLAGQSPPAPLPPGPPFQVEAESLCDVATARATDSAINSCGPRSAGGAGGGVTLPLEAHSW
jgi:hypothetical protein